MMQKFNNTFRYMYLEYTFALIINDFTMYSREICAAVLTFKKANTNNEHCFCLDA